MAHTSKRIPGFLWRLVYKTQFPTFRCIFLITSSLFSKLPKVCGDLMFVTRSINTNATIHTLTYSLFPFRKVEKENISNDQGVHVGMREL